LQSNHVNTGGRKPPRFFSRFGIHLGAGAFRFRFIAVEKAVRSDDYRRNGSRNPRFVCQFVRNPSLELADSVPK
jgi:hypothetical protein